jgi:hypothetical protein
MFHNKTITLTDTEITLLQYILNTYIAKDNVDLYQLVKDPLSVDIWTEEYLKKYGVEPWFQWYRDDKYHAHQMMRPETIAYYLNDRIEEQIND